MNELELIKRLAAIESRLLRVEQRTQEYDTVLDPSGWISEAFDVQERHFGRIEHKLDIILQHLTGMQDDTRST